MSHTAVIFLLKPFPVRLTDVIGHIAAAGFVAVAMVTESPRMACAIKDNIKFGLKPGGELVVDTTIAMKYGRIIML